MRMIFKKYETKEEFIQENLEILLKEEAENETIIGILLEHDSTKVNKWLLGRIEDENNIEAIFIVDDDKIGLLVHFPNKEVTKELVTFLLENIIKLNINLKEIVFPRKYVSLLLEIFDEKENFEILETRYTDTLKLEKLCGNQELEVSEKLIKLDENYNSEKLIPIVKEIYKDIYGKKECSDEEALRISKIYLKKGTYILTDRKEEQIYTQVVNVRNQINGSAIGAIITPTEFRGKGYAKKCIYLVCKEFLSKKEFVVLHVNIKNEPAIALYNKIGFKKIDELVKVKLNINK